MREDRRRTREGRAADRMKKERRRRMTERADGDEVVALEGQT